MKYICQFCKATNHHICVNRKWKRKSKSEDSVACQCDCNQSDTVFGVR